MKLKPIEVKALEPYKIWIRYSDGVEGIIDYADIAGQGIFKKWEDPQFFKSVFIVDEWGGISWPQELELDPVVTYQQVSGLSMKEASKKFYG
jgi:Protein of unknown function (DUF2442)